MKRWISVLLLAVLLLCGCSAGNDSGKETEPTGLPAGIMQKEDPAGDDSLNILFIGDSSAFYWMDELWGLLDAAGFENVNVCNLYYSASLAKHWEFFRTDAAVYQLSRYTSDGKQVVENCTMEAALRLLNWDHISLHNNKSSMALKSKEDAAAVAEPYLTNLLQAIQKEFPLSTYYWQENWSPEVGYGNSTYTMESVEQRTEMHSVVRYVAKQMEKNHGLKVIPTGDAWEKVRNLELFATPIPGVGVEKFTLCSRITAAGAFKDDLGHDGDIGGGQFLNACAGFEVITGQSCVGNSFKPQYTLNGIDCSLTEEKIEILQNAAHQAVAEWVKD